MAKKKKIFVKFVLVISLLAVLACFGIYSYFSWKIEQRFSGRLWSIPSYVFSDSLLVFAGQKISIKTLCTMLRNRLYMKVSTEPERPGEFLVEGNKVKVWFRNFDFPGRSISGGKVIFEFSSGILKNLRKDGKNLIYWEMEPIELARYYGKDKESRILISIKKTPKYLKDAVIAIEDRRFYEHKGVDLIGVLRALWVDIKARRIVQGGSTITQQLVKNYFLRPERTIKRKIQEAIIAVILESKYTKDQILEMYLNEIYMGQRGAIAIHGMGEAARYYFGKNVEDLSLAEAALLAGMIKAPNYYNPLLHPKRAKIRRNTVLKAMADMHMISPDELTKASRAPIRVFSGFRPLKRAPYFVDAVFEQLKQLYDPETLEKEGLVVYTTLNPEIEHNAEVSLRTLLQHFEKIKPFLRAKSPKVALQGVIIAVQPKTGAVRALVGGRDYSVSMYNRALFAKRQPGSAIKPFIYYAAIHEGWTPVSWLDDEPIAVTIGKKVWKPKNYDHRFRGRVMLRDALEKSLNVPTVRLAMAIGIDKIISVMKKFGFQSVIKPYPSIALGAFEIRPFELISAYTVFANEGQRTYLLTIKEVYDSKGHLEKQKHMEWQKVITPEEAYLITSLLEGVVKEGTARNLKNLGISFPCAGKTGTTSDYRDSWFVGYTTDMATLVWVGFDNNRSTKLSGASGAMKIWAHFMKSIKPWINPQPFYPPQNIVYKTICKDSGALATDLCPRTRKEAFIKGTEPTHLCPIHSRGNYDEVWTH